MARLHKHPSGPRSSFAVFMEHFERKGAEGVFSYECFIEWTETRKEPPKKPEESFRRTITAHVCKSSGRRPFEPHVEAEILRFIRQKKIWPMAEKLGLNIGANGFRAQGFHESNGTAVSLPPLSSYESAASEVMVERKESDSVGRPAVISIVPLEELPIEKDLTKGESMITAGEVRKRQRSEMECFERKVTDEPTRKMTFIYPSHVQVDEEVAGLEGDVLLGEWLKEPELLQQAIGSTGVDCTKLYTAKDAQSAFVANILRTFSPAQFLEFKEKSGMNIFSSAGLYIVENIVEKRFIFETTKREFLCPIDQDSMKFEVVGPNNRGSMGKLCVDLPALRYVGTNQGFRDIIKGEVSGLPCAAVQRSQIHTALLLNWAGPLLRSRGHVWTHMRFPDQETGEYIVLRCLWEASPTNPREIVLTVQDVSHMYDEWARREEPILI